MGFTLREIDVLMRGLDAYQRTKIDKALLDGMIHIMSSGRENVDAVAEEAHARLKAVENSNEEMADFIVLLKAKLVGLKASATVAHVEEMLSES